MILKLEAERGFLDLKARHFDPKGLNLEFNNV